MPWLYNINDETERLSSILPVYSQFSILGGLSASAILPPSLGTINHWFYKRRGLTTGVSCISGGPDHPSGEVGGQIRH
ncbi:hypothetical protein ETB97_001819 [Aspergillus alliaceus]|uniref:Uncharacterized protein n=1 Tax=Petromyces alliaceus TaxID=209559 RepID=A0A8H6A438_PETAA|nr:hypothetical protein ETB97_001819 [Aspergillus burnettii]